MYVFDLGKNFAGFCRLKVAGQGRDRDQAALAERLNPDGTIYTTNLRARPRAPTPTSAGAAGSRSGEPRFTFHGFQYVEVDRAIPAQPTAGAITGMALTPHAPSPARSSGPTRCSTSSIATSTGPSAANFIDIPTDCPQRDERLGWTGDAQVYIRTATCNTDVAGVLHQVAGRPRRRPARGRPVSRMVAPRKVAGGDGGPGLGRRRHHLPWTIYEVYGDRSCWRTHYDAMMRYVEFWRRGAPRRTCFRPTSSTASATG